MGTVQPFIGFDIEIADEIPAGGRIEDYRLGITCAATYDSGGRIKLWTPSLTNAFSQSALYHPRMSPQQCRGIIEFLYAKHQEGHHIVTWNGMGFDFRVLAAEAQLDLVDWDNLVDLAWSHIDIAFQMLCEKGFMAGLNSAAKGMHLQGKVEGMSGAQAPEMWKEGREAQDKVIEYVVQDARTTALLYNSIVITGGMSWITQSGGRARFPWVPARPEETNGARLLTVKEANALPLPDTSWLSVVRERGSYTGWAAGNERC